MTIKISNTAETSQEAGAAFETEVLARLYHGTALEWLGLPASRFA